MNILLLAWIEGLHTCLAFRHVVSTTPITRVNQIELQWFALTRRFDCLDQESASNIFIHLWNCQPFSVSPIHPYESHYIDSVLWTFIWLDSGSAGKAFTFWTNSLGTQTLVYPLRASPKGTKFSGASGFDHQHRFGKHLHLPCVKGMSWRRWNIVNIMFLDSQPLCSMWSWCANNCIRNI